MRRYLVTGGAGFIGSNFIRGLLSTEPKATVVNLDLLTYAGVEETVAELNHLDRHEFVYGDIRDSTLVDSLVAATDVVVHFAAESHVDRSISGPRAFLSTNVVGTGVLLEAACRHQVDRFVQISTDEVYGPIFADAADETTDLNPSSPYAASKASADLVVAAYRKTYGFAAITARCTNNYGPYQHPEKLIPSSIIRLLDGGSIQLYGDGLHERDWLWADDHCAALRMLVDEGVPGEVYNISSEVTAINRDVADRLLDLVGTGSIEYVADRPGHDRRYALDSSKLRALGWRPSVDLETGLERTVAWYRGHPDWWSPLLEPS